MWILLSQEKERKQDVPCVTRFSQGSLIRRTQLMLAKIVTRNVLSVTRTLIFIKLRMDRKQSPNVSKTVQDSKKLMTTIRKSWSRS